MPTLATTSEPAESGANLAALRTRWAEIRAVWRSTVFGAFATIGADGGPQVTPIGSVYLDPHEPRGYFHPIFATRLRSALAQDQRFELLFVDARASRWLSALVRGRFDQLIAARLKGRALGPCRQSTEEEVARWRRKVRGVRWTRGHDLLWKDVRFVQELAFDALVPVRLGAMQRG